MSSAPIPAKATQSQGRVLVVDDVPAVVRSFQRILEAAGFEVATANDGEEAAAWMQREPVDAVLSDISMPVLDGIEFLKLMRAQDRDVPVVLVTGTPSMETALPAIEHGAISYMLKPVDPKALREKVGRAVRLRRLAEVQRQAALLLPDAVPEKRDAALHARFDAALAGLTVAYQPIISWSRRRVAGYEALVRSAEPSLANPGALFAAAEQLGRTTDLTRAIRLVAPGPMLAEPRRGQLYFNLHVCDLDDDTLLDPDSPLARLGERCVLEVTERASLDQVTGARAKVARLRELGFRIAVDDLGAGYAGLSTFAMLEPDIVKLDMTLVRDIHREPTKQRLVESITRLCADMGIEVVGEGVEVVQERDALVRLGCDLLQGYLFARPGPPFIDPVI